MANKKHPLEVFTYHSGGRGGIRTLGTFYRTPVFKTGTFNHSVTLPTATSVQNLAEEGRFELPLQISPY